MTTRNGMLPAPTELRPRLLGRLPKRNAARGEVAQFAEALNVSNDNFEHNENPKSGVFCKSTGAGNRTLHPRQP